MGGGSIDFPSPQEVGRSQFSWNNLNQYTPYGSVEYQAPVLGPGGVLLTPGSMTQSMDPNLLRLQESMMGLRESALGQMGNLLGAGNFNLNGQGGYQNPTGQPPVYYDDPNIDTGGDGLPPKLIQTYGSSGHRGDPNQAQYTPNPYMPGRQQGNTPANAPGQIND